VRDGIPAPLGGTAHFPAMQKLIRAMQKLTKIIDHARLVGLA
jgi:hypothetical protein